MAANVMEKSFLRRGMPTILWQERIFFFARHGARGEEEEAVTLIHNSHPSLDFLPQFSGFHCPTGRLLRTHPVISPVIS
jgi:hypothetical protein